jgi:uncharacterized protein (TIGR03067 family)
MRVRRLLVIAGTVGAAAAAVATYFVLRPENDPAHAEMSKLLGTWQMVAGENDGARASDRSVREHTFTFAADGTYSTAAGDKLLSIGSYALDPQKTPKTVDFKSTSGALSGQTLYGLYDLTGDELKFCYCVTGSDRPSTISAESGSGHVLMIYKRVAER